MIDAALHQVEAAAKGVLRLCQLVGGDGDDAVLTQFDGNGRAPYPQLQLAASRQ